MKNRFTMHVLSWVLSVPVFLAATLSAAVYAKEKPEDYAFQIPLEVSGQGPWYRFNIPMSVQMAASFADLRDLRVFNRASEALPYALTSVAVQNVETQQENPVRIFPLYGSVSAPELVENIRIQRNQAGTVIELSAPHAATENVANDKPLRGWLLDTSAVNYALDRLLLEWQGQEEGFQRFSIETSNDLHHWQTWGEGQIARFSFNNEGIDQNEIRLPGKKARYIRLLWRTPDTAVPLTGARVQGRFSSIESAPLIWSEPLTGWRSGENEFIWELPLALPVEQVRIDIAQANTLAPVALSGRIRIEQRKGESPVWTPLARGILYRLPLNGQESVQDTLSLSGGLVRQLRLQVDPRGGGFGSDTPMLHIGLRPSELTFLARGEAPYVLAFGRQDAQSASLPITTLIPGYPSGSRTALGHIRLLKDVNTEEMRVPVPATGTVQTPPVDWKKRGLWAILILGVGVLGVMAFSLLSSSKAEKPVR